MSAPRRLRASLPKWRASCRAKRGRGVQADTAAKTAPRRSAPRRLRASLPKWRASCRAKRGRVSAVAMEISGHRLLEFRGFPRRRLDLQREALHEADFRSVAQIA